MDYPNYRNKHLEKALISPINYIKWAGKGTASKRPDKYIFVYYPYLANHFRKKYSPQKVGIYRLLTIYQHKNIGLVHMTGVGSPHAAAILEEIVALGGKEFINIGSAGGLQGFGIYLCERAIRDEGTSHHYAKPAKYSYPDAQLTARLGKSMSKMSLDFEKGTSWTIDAPYMETIAEIKHYRNEGVKTVEMEAAALFAVAKVRHVKVASAHVVSDLLDEKKWDPQFKANHVRMKLRKLVDAAVDALTKK